ncbi:MAG: SiaC family regulatory phosphoprotein [Chloroherpetonaceae bacterium]|nr:SiaC family regulatory phosphoprotein [Chloroherpetonaceae bacterium]
MKKAYKEGKKVEVKWYHNEADEQMQETGEEFAEHLTLPFKVIAYK